MILTARLAPDCCRPRAPAGHTYSDGTSHRVAAPSSMVCMLVVTAERGLLRPPAATVQHKLRCLVPSRRAATRPTSPCASSLASTATPTMAASAAELPQQLPSTRTFFLDAFALRQWDDPSCSGARISYGKAEFVARIQEAHDAGAALVDGYAPFCKHVFVPNFVGAKAGALPVTDANRHLLRSGYTRRRPEELAVLARCGCVCLCDVRSV